MALVGYSDSEGSEDETQTVPIKIIPKTGKPAFGKLVDSAGTRKIKVDLPNTKPDPTQPEERPAKRAKFGSGASSFNALLPPPKRTEEIAKKGGLGSGVSLKTSGAAAFSREPVDDSFDDVALSKADDEGDSKASDADAVANGTPAAEPEVVKTVGNPMRFKPLSVANNKKKPKRPVVSAVPLKGETPVKLNDHKEEAPTQAKPKPKPSLFFSVASEQQPDSRSATMQAYEPMMDATGATSEIEYANNENEFSTQAPLGPNSLDAVAADLNLSAADRRRLFGRGAAGAQAINITNFNMDAEYRKNEQLRASGETIQHNAVRAIAPGKHSLQQLVNSASTQKEALEDAWADGKRNKGEAGNKYGWGR